MENRIRFRNRQWFQKTLVYMLFGLFTAKAQAGLLFGAPDVIAQPLGISVQNGDTAIVTCTATSVTGFTSWNWYCNGKLVPASQSVTVNAIVGVESILTIPHFSSTNSGTYYLAVANNYGTTDSSNASVVVVLNTVSNVLSAVTGASKMLTSGFKLQFSAPAGSNVVIEATSALGSWSPICTNVATGGSVTYTDAAALSYPSRFYRARLK
jgi:hypothetical protein